MAVAVTIVAVPACAQPAPPNAAAALSTSELLDLARRLLDEGSYDTAAVLLGQLTTDGRGGTERDFLAGMVAMARGDYGRAEELFRKILADDPTLVRVRLELARTLFLAGKDEQSDYHFRLAIAQNPPEEVVANVARFREAIRARRAWRFNVTVGIAPDSNINSATAKEQVDLFGLPFRLDPDARAKSGVGLVAGGDASVRLFRETGMPLYVAAYGRMVRYSDHRFNDVYAGIEAGPEFQLSGGRLRAVATGLNRWYGGDQLVASAGAMVHYDKVVNGALSLEGSLAARNNDYAGRNDMDGWDFEAGVSANRALDARTVGYGYARLQRSIAADSSQSNWEGRVGLGGLRELRGGWRPEVLLEGGRRVHDAEYPLFGNTRKDWSLRATASLYKRDWNVVGLAPSLRVTWTRNFSTVTLYDERRLRAELGFTKAF